MLTGLPPSWQRKAAARPSPHPGGKPAEPWPHGGIFFKAGVAGAEQPVNIGQAVSLPGCQGGEGPRYSSSRALRGAQPHLSARGRKGIPPLRSSCRRPRRETGVNSSVSTLWGKSQGEGILPAHPAGGKAIPSSATQKSQWGVHPIHRQEGLQFAAKHRLQPAGRLPLGQKLPSKSGSFRQPLGQQANQRQIVFYIPPSQEAHRKGNGGTGRAGRGL